MTDVLAIILPVFLVLGFGYVAVWRGLMSDEHVDGLMRFAQGFALPCLLFRAMSTLDLGQTFHPALLVSFYAGAVAGFVVALFGARLLFGRPWEDSIAIGFVGLFSNSLLLGVPITERAYGTEALEANFAIVAMHAPFCYALGITVMEVVRARGENLARLPARVFGAVFRNALVIGIALGLAVNLTGVTVPEVVAEAVDLMVRAALPAALFGLGGILYRYRPEGDLRVILFVIAVSLVLHPAITWTLGRAFGLEVPALRSAVVTAAMAPGVNAYLFANIYGVAKRVAASSVLIATALSVLTASVWLSILP
ncbi:AEC family transporter [Wenxinia marina]|uniref:Putative permease n=1 Tax=Wenxinia marina DSM 24838 TaxID=1123501 RepID=A0A0D0QCZ3_9RHOB|nr:AEC family transporter [Wenxinia marina]KIQ70182.1 putative permease [Wenxinia marina DSM 24838]GGL50761.1 malonate transporter [Wenxinia marina]